MKILDSDTIALPVVGEKTDNCDRRVEVSLIELQGGREVRAVHHRGDERFGSYSFRVIDENWQTCACRNTDEPPVEVVQAVEQFGYHVTDACSHFEEYVDLRHVSRIFETISEIYTTNSDPLLRGLLSHAQHSLAIVLFNLDLRESLVENHGRSALDIVMTETWERIVEESEREVDWLNASDFYDDLTEVATDGGYISPDEFDVVNSWSVDEIVSSHKITDQYDTESVVHLNASEAKGTRKLLVTIFENSHVHRYDFHVLDSDEKICVVQGDGSEGRPPIGVINEVNDAGYEIKNVSVPQSDDPEWKQMADAHHLLADIKQSYDKGDPLYECLNRGQKVIEDAIFVAIHREVMEPEEYIRTLTRAVHASSFVGSVDELESYPLVSSLEEFLTEYFSELVGPQASRKVREFYREREIF